MSKVHFFAAPEPDVEIEKHGKDVIAACGKKIPSAMPVMKINITEGSLEAANTLSLCKECMVMVLPPILAPERGKEISYLYGVLPKEEALKLNSQSEE